MNTFVKVMHASTCNCAACASVPTLGIEMPYEVVKENCLAVACPKAAAMWSSKNKLSASEVTVKSNKKAIFKCYVCKQEFEAQICHVARSIENGFTGYYDCAMRRKNAISKKS